MHDQTQGRPPEGDWLGTPYVRFERKGSLASCIVDRPEARNAMTGAMYFAVRCVGFAAGQELTLLTALAAWNQHRGPAPHRYDATAVTAPELHHALQSMIVQRWMQRRRRSDERGALYAAVAANLDVPAEDFRVLMIDEQQQLHGFLTGETAVQSTFDTDSEFVELDPDIELITDFLTS